MTNFNMMPLFCSPIAVTEIDKDVCNSLKNLASKVTWFARDKKRDEGYSVSKDTNILVPDAETTGGGKAINTKNNLYNYFAAYCQNYIKELSFDCDIQLTTSWFSRTEPGGSSGHISNYNSWYTAVVFFDEEYSKDCGDTEFYRESHGPFPTSDPSKYNIYSADYFPLLPQYRAMIIYPSSLKYRINVNRSNEFRRSFQFNIMPKGRIGTGEYVFDYK